MHRRIAQGVALGCLLCMLPAASGQRSSNDPVGRLPENERSSFADFILRQVNPCNTDYGVMVADLRRTAVEKSIDDVYFWSNSIALLLLLIVSAKMLHSNRQLRRLELSSVRFLTCYHNAWVDALMQSKKAVSRYDALARLCNAATENAHEVSALPPQFAQKKARQSPDIVQSSSPSMAPKDLPNGGGVSSPTAASPNPQNAHKHMELIAQINTLQQQLNTEHERVRNLQNELKKEKEVNKNQRRLPDPQGNLDFKKE